MANIIVAISGGIAAYKACDLISGLKANQHDVRVIMTDHAKEFITELTLATLSQHPVMSNMFAERQGKVDHIEVAKWANIFIVYPATANIIAKFANGIADDLVSTVFLALPYNKVLRFICPSMNTEMLLNPIVQENLEKLNKMYPELDRQNKNCCEIGCLEVINPIDGKLACGDTGKGKIESPRKVVDKIEDILRS